jgi:hypothetical protein
LPWFSADDKGLASDSFEQWIETLRQVGFSGNHDQQFLAFRRFRTSENRGAQVALATLGVFRIEPAGQRGADGAARNVNRIFRESCRYALFAEHYVFNRRIVGQHGENGFCVAAGIGGRIGYTRAILRESSRFFAGPVVDC